MSVTDLDDFIGREGAWTAMSIKLPDGSHTLPEAVDHRLRRLLQVSSDFVGKPLDRCRVLDLACLEGHYGLEFALHGADVMGIEGRQVSVNKCNFVKRAYGLERLSFVVDDVRNLGRARYGEFDIVICSGLLYHLPAGDACALLKAIHECCSGIAVIDTFVSLWGKEAASGAGFALRGHTYGEHDETESANDKAGKLWASLDNNTSFWLTEASLVNVLTGVGFSSVCQVLAPTMPRMLHDRRTYVAARRARVDIKSSDATQRQPLVDLEEGPNDRFDASQVSTGRLHRLAKAHLPAPVKRALKPLLRAVGVLPADTTPAFMRASGEAPRTGRSGDH